MAKEKPTYEELVNFVSQLQKRVELLEKEFLQLKKENIELSKKNIKLSKENIELKERLAKYENPKNSRNSSVPPSKDENRPFKTKSLREQTGKKPGGQKGHEGKTLGMVNEPDHIENHIPEYCQCCGEDISNLPYEFVEKRQVIDIPEIKPKVTEHRIYKKTCNCGHTTESSFPHEVNASVSYGSNIESLIGYFHTRQYVPFKRMQEIFRDIFQLTVSEGGIHYLLNKLVEKAYPAYEMIKSKLQKSKAKFIGTDETGTKMNGENQWVWTWQNDEATFITFSDNRGEKTITDTFKDGFPESVLVHDCWKSHFNTPALSHQLCMAHLLRELQYFEERYDHKWSRVFKLLLILAIHLKNRLILNDYYYSNTHRDLLEKRLDRLLDYNIDPTYKELVSFQKRMNKYRDYIFTFLYHPKVPPDNNGSERAIRNIKVKQKISGQFKSPTGAFNFAVLRSITDTALKNGQNILKALKIIANWQGTD